MAKVTITLEDNAEGKVVMSTGYEGGFNANSQAHQYSRIMLAHANNYGKEPAAPMPAPKQEKSSIVIARH